MKMLPVVNSPKANDMEYLGLRFYEHELHQQLINTQCKFWPESLVELVDCNVKQQGLCGDVISVSIADWIKGVRFNNPALRSV